jgi:hypothetical protein
MVVMDLSCFKLGPIYWKFKEFQYQKLKIVSRLIKLHRYAGRPSSLPMVKVNHFLCRLYGVVATYRDHFSVVCPSVRPSQNLSGLLLINYWCNFIQTLQEWSVPSLVVHNCQHFPVQWFLLELWPFNNF